MASQFFCLTRARLNKLLGNQTAHAVDKPTAQAPRLLRTGREPHIGISGCGGSSSRRSSSSSSSSGSGSGSRRRRRRRSGRVADDDDDVDDADDDDDDADVDGDEVTTVVIRLMHIFRVARMCPCSKLGSTRNGIWALKTTLPRLTSHPNTSFGGFLFLTSMISWRHHKASQPFRRWGSNATK